MQYPITFDYPAKTFQRTAFAVALAVLGGFAVLFNLSSGLYGVMDNIGGFFVSLIVLTLGAGMLWGMHNPQEIALTETALHLPKTFVSGNAQSIPYEDILGVSVIIHYWSQTCIIHWVGGKFSTSNLMMGHTKMFNLIEEIHNHAPHLGAPPIGTLGGVFRAGQGAMPK